MIVREDLQLDHIYIDFATQARDTQNLSRPRPRTIRARPSNQQRRPPSLPFLLPPRLPLERWETRSTLTESPSSLPPLICLGTPVNLTTRTSNLTILFVRLLSSHLLPFLRPPPPPPSLSLSEADTFSPTPTAAAFPPPSLPLAPPPLLFEFSVGRGRFPSLSASHSSR